MPAGLLTTSRWLSSYRISSVGMRTVGVRGFGRIAEIEMPGLYRDPRPARGGVAELKTHSATLSARWSAGNGVRLEQMACPRVVPSGSRVVLECLSPCDRVRSVMACPRVCARVCFPRVCFLRAGERLSPRERVSACPRVVCPSGVCSRVMACPRAMSWPVPVCVPRMPVPVRPLECLSPCGRVRSVMACPRVVVPVSCHGLSPCVPVCQSPMS